MVAQKKPANSKCSGCLELEVSELMRGWPELSQTCVGFEMLDRQCRALADTIDAQEQVQHKGIDAVEKFVKHDSDTTVAHL